jgi:hypothetical protein
MTDRQTDRKNELTFGYKQLTYNGNRLVPRGQGDLSFPTESSRHLAEDPVDRDGFVGEGGVCHLHGEALTILHSDPRLK